MVRSRIREGKIKDSSHLANKIFKWIIKNNKGKSLTTKDIKEIAKDVFGEPQVSVGTVKQVKELLVENGKVNLKDNLKDNLTDIIIDSINHFKYDLGETPSVDDIIEDILNNYDIINEEATPELTESLYKEILDVTFRKGIDIKDSGLFNRTRRKTDSNPTTNPTVMSEYQELLKELTNSFTDFTTEPYLYDSMSEYQDFLSIYEVLDGKEKLPDKPLVVLTYLYNELEEEKDNWEVRLELDKKRLDFGWETKAFNSPEKEDAKYLIVGVKGDKIGSIKLGDSYIDFETIFWGIYDNEFDLPFKRTLEYIEEKYADKIWEDMDSKADLSVLTKEEQKDIIRYAKEEALLWDNIDIYNSHARYKSNEEINEQLKKYFGIKNKRIYDSKIKDNKERKTLKGFVEHLNNYFKEVGFEDVFNFVAKGKVFYDENGYYSRGLEEEGSSIPDDVREQAEVYFGDAYDYIEAENYTEFCVVLKTGIADAIRFGNKSDEDGDILGYEKAIRKRIKINLDILKQQLEPYGFKLEKYDNKKVYSVKHLETGEVIEFDKEHIINLNCSTREFRYNNQTLIDNLEQVLEDLSVKDSRLTRKQKIWYASELEKSIDPKFLRRNYILKRLKGAKK